MVNVAEAIGNTPLVALDRLTAGMDGRILAKLECFNPGYSKKDRAALRTVEDARANGSLAPGQVVVELTSGNMGTGLAIAALAFGHPFVAVMSRGNSAERATMMRALGAEVVLVDQAEGGIAGQVSKADLELVEERACRETLNRNAFMADQFNNSSNWRAHFDTTGPEIWEQSERAITAFCDFVGSGGTYAGVTRYLKQQRPDIACYLVEPEGAAVLSGERLRDPNHPIQGGGYSRRNLRFLDNVPVDGYLTVTGEEARDTARHLAAVEGIFAGYSTGANCAAALKLWDGPLKGASIAIIVCDSGLKYLSTDLWSDI
ncbi:MAG: cysteine synthase family protein [Pacificimonas sp.]|jgi:cysteine synthase A|nr:cysteine synthase family protein [Pacificimonas sp.]